MRPSAASLSVAKVEAGVNATDLLNSKRMLPEIETEKARMLAVLL
jgi:hypothetical protein